MLISAYDLHHGNLTEFDAGVTEITFVDSGGYEISDQQDLSSPYAYSGETGEWNEQLYTETLRRWPEQAPAVFVSFDRANLPMREQVAHAVELTEQFPRQLHAFLAKPEQNCRFIDVGSIGSQARELSRFHILGVTEKELGESFIHRMKAIAQLRRFLDGQGLNPIPIHVFGSLDPMSVCLYFISGAEIFDGLTWLRYAYAMDAAMYRQNGAILHDLLTQRDDRVKMWAMTHNIGQLEALRNKMRRFLNDRDFAVFPRNGEWLRHAKDLLRAEFNGEDL